MSMKKLWSFVCRKWTLVCHRIMDSMKKPEPIWLDIERWESQESDLSKTIKKSALLLIGASIFCVLTLGESDVVLIAKDARVNLPVPSLTAPFSSFLLFGPIILFGIYGYIHIHLSYLKRLITPVGAHYTPTFFNLPSFWARFIASAILYWMMPAVLGLFAWKALPRPEGFFLFFETGMALMISTLLFLKSNSHKRISLRTTILIIVLFGSVGLVTFSFVQVTVTLACQKPIPELIISRKISFQDENLQQKDLTGTQLKNVSFSRARLSGADLSFSTFSGANFSAADMSGVKAKKANLDLVQLDATDMSDSDLSGSTLYSSNLQNANLQGANLYHSDLSDADLQGSVLRGANLVYANMRRAKLGGAVLLNADLNGAILLSATGLDCAELKSAINWTSSYRDQGLACGAPIPEASGNSGGNGAGGNGSASSLGKILCHAAVDRPNHVLFYLKAYFGLRQGWQGSPAKPLEQRWSSP